jgi:hypothetical protein
MQSYLRKSYSFARRQAQVSEVEEEEICVWWSQVRESSQSVSGKL